MSVLRVHIIYDVEGWAYHQRAKALFKYAPPDILVTMGAGPGEIPECDVVLCLCYGSAMSTRQILDRRTARPRLVVGYNVGWGYRAEHFGLCIRAGDWVVFNNRENWERHKRPERTACISNGVDREVYRVTVPQDQRPLRCLSIGSTYHLANNDDLKGHRSHLLPLVDRLARRGIETDFRLVDSVRGGRMGPEEMVDWYNTGAVYVVASRVEGTPNPALEAASCGCIVVSTRVGNMPELIRDDHNGVLVDRTVAALEAGIVAAAEARATMGPAMLRAIEAWDWRARAQEYYALFRRVAVAA